MNTNDDLDLNDDLRAEYDLSQLTGKVQGRYIEQYRQESNGEQRMQTALRLTAKVEAGGKIELIDTHLPVGQSVEVIVLLPTDTPQQHSIKDVLAEAPGHLSFHTAAEVDQYVREERDAWER